MKFRPFGLGIAGLAALVTASAAVASTGPLPGPAPAVLAQLGATPAPTPTASARPQRGRRATGESPSPAAAPSESPVPAQFSSLDGIWEIELQPLNSRRATYSHLRLAQQGNLVSGYWEHDPNRTRSPLVGTFDGRLFQFTVDLGGGKSVTMAGYGENFSDFVGLMRNTPTDQGTPFTAQHRKKERPQ